MSDEEKTISSYLVKTLGVPASDLELEAPLFSAGLLDSFAMMDLVSFIEESWKFRVRAKDVTLDNFDSIEKILSYIGRQTPK